MEVPCAWMGGLGWVHAQEQMHTSGISCQLAGANLAPTSSHACFDALGRDFSAGVFTCKEREEANKTAGINHREEANKTAGINHHIRVNDPQNRDRVNDPQIRVNIPRICWNVPAQARLRGATHLRLGGALLAAPEVTLRFELARIAHHAATGGGAVADGNYLFLGPHLRIWN